MRNKRGLSGIVATLLIILLVIVAVAIVWTVVRNVLEKGSDEVGFSTITTTLDVQDVQVADGIASVNVKREVGDGNVVGVKIVVSDGQNSISQDFIQSLEELESQTFDVDVSSLSGVSEVLVSPILELPSGEQVLGEVTDNYVVSEEQGGSPAGEGGSPGGGGGDPECGNNIIDGTDVCDGTALNSETCVTQGFDAGDLTCLPDCTGYDNSSCTGGTCINGTTELCALQLGVCALSEQTCTDSAWPGCEGVYTGIIGYEAIETSCSDLADNDCDGLVDIADETCSLILANGNISSVWPGSAPRYLDSQHLPFDDITIATYIGKWASFSDRLGLCFQISSAGHNYDLGPPVYNMSFIGFQYAISSPNLVNTQTGGAIFNIYKTEADCLAA
jgi:hypothetical protein